MMHLIPYGLYESKFDDWRPDDSVFTDLIDNARKYKEDEFVEEYVYLYGLNTTKVINSVKKGDTVEIGIRVRDENGKNVYDSRGMQAYAPYKIVTADRDYDSVWDFIMDNAGDVEETARSLWRENSKRSKPRFKRDASTVKAYHASPNKFKKFEYQEDRASGQLGADLGFFFFLDRKNAEYYARVHKDNHGVGYVYEVSINPGNQMKLCGEGIGTSWNRYSEINQANIEEYDSVLIRDADTGYGITDELVVFDDDNIKIEKITKI